MIKASRGPNVGADPLLKEARQPRTTLSSQSRSTKYRMLRRTQESVVMMFTPGWRPKPLCFGTFSPKKGIPPHLLEDKPCQMPRQLLNFNITIVEKVPELILPKDAHAWMDKFVCQIGLPFSPLVSIPRCPQILEEVEEGFKLSF